MAPATPNISSEFGITSSAEAALVTSIFVLAYGAFSLPIPPSEHSPLNSNNLFSDGSIGTLHRDTSQLPLTFTLQKVLGPLSEIYGRVRVIQGSNVFFFVWNLVCGFSHTPAQIIVFRFLAGLGGSAPLAAGAGSLADIWRPEERGRAIAIYSLAPLLGPSLGRLSYIPSNLIASSTTKYQVLLRALGLLKELPGDGCSGLLPSLPSHFKYLDFSSCANVRPLPIISSYIPR